MFFKKKKNSKIKCEDCGHKNPAKHKHCVECGNSLRSPEEEMADFGMLGRSDMEESDFFAHPMNQGKNLGFMDKILSTAISGLLSSIEKNMEKELKRNLKGPMNNSPHIQSSPRGIKITFGAPKKVKAKAEKSKKTKESFQPTKEQIDKISKLPKSQAKTNIRRLPDKIVYELKTPGVSSTEDIFITKLENGYELKAIGNKKVYVNNLPLNHPIKRLSLKNSQLSVEFIEPDFSDNFPDFGF